MYENHLLAPFGDSHVHFWGKITEIPSVSNDASVPTIYWMGPAKAYGLEHQTENKTHERFLLIKKNLEDFNLIPIACFGEIDSRINCTKKFLFDGSHLHVEYLVKSYLRKLNEINNNNIVIWGPPPSAPDDGMFNDELPAYGDNMTRNYLTHIFNKAIIRGVQDYSKLNFLTFFYDMVDSDLSTKKNILHDGCHLSVKFQDSSKQLLYKLLDTGSKAMFNLDRFNAIGSYKRIFRPIPSGERRPFISFYKNKDGELKEYFSYQPFSPIDTKIEFATIEKVN